MKQTLPNRSVIVTCLVWLTVFSATSSFVLATNRLQIEWDGVFYFSILRSIYCDGDIDFSNEADHYPWIKRSYGETLPNGLVANPFPLGSALLWLPFYAIGDSYCENKSTSACDGYSQPYVIAVMIGTVFWTTLGLALTARSLKGVLTASSWLTTCTSITMMALASPLVFYLTVDTDYSHGNSFFAVSLLLYLTVTCMRRAAVLRWQAFVYGLAVGLVFMVRWQDLVMGMLVIPVLLHIQKEKRPGFIMCFSAGTLLGALPQLLFWHLLYGTLLTIPQGGNFLNIHNIVKFFFSTWNGVFLWHPIVLVGVIGLLVFLRNTLAEPKRKWLLFGIIMCLIVFLEMVISAMSHDWWAGGAFGQRRLVSTLPLLCVGLLQLSCYAGQKKTWKNISLAFLITAMVTWNLLALTRYHQGKLPFNPADLNNYPSLKVYGHYDYARRFNDIMNGSNP